jgi:glycosyltransferase involved in cell wall biosynthesis
MSRTNQRGGQDVPEDRPTVVVPTRNSERTIESCLRSLRDQSLQCSVVVVDNHSRDATRSLADAYADLVIVGGPERSAQRNLGARAAPASVVGFVDSDMVVGPHVVEQAVQAIASGAGAVIVPERSFGEGFWAGVRAYERSFYEGAEAVEAARFFAWRVFDAIGGWDEELTGPEDWDLTLRARRIAPVARCEDAIAHDEGRLRYLDACRKKAAYAVGLRRFAAKHGVRMLGATARRPYVRRPWVLANARGAGLLALKAGEATAALATLLREPQARPSDVSVAAQR